MLLREFFNHIQRKIIKEGGNLEIDNPNFDPSKPESPDNPRKLQAQEIKLASTEISDEVQDRTHMVSVLKKLFLDINEKFTATYKKPLFDNKLLNLEIHEFMAGSSKHFFDLLRPNPNFNPSQPESEKNPKMVGLSDEEFKKYKPLVGDIDIQCNQEMKEELLEFLNSNIGIPFGNITLLGSPSQGNEQYNTLWQIINPPLRLQIDFEYGRYAPETGKPDEWTRFSHSAAWEDIKQGIKGVFHKYIYRALAKAEPTPKYLARLDGLGKNRKMKIFGGADGKIEVVDYNNPPEPVIDPNFSFSVASAGGGGLRYRYKDLEPKYTEDPYNLPLEINGIPVMHTLESKESEYQQDLRTQFTSFFGTIPQGDDRKLQDSFVGSLELMNKYLTEEEKRNTVQDFFEILFEPGAQMITKDDPGRDKAIKFAAVNKMLPVLGLDDMMSTAESMSDFYIADFNDLQQFKQTYDKENPNPVNAKGQPKKPQYGKERKDAIAAGTWKALNVPSAQPLTEDDASPNYAREGIPHIFSRRKDKNGNIVPSSAEISDAGFIEICKEIANNGGKLDGMSISLKVDGAGIRFGKDQSGKSFFMSSQGEPIYPENQTHFIDYFKQKTGINDLNDIPDDDELLKSQAQRALNYDNAGNIIRNSKFVQDLPPDTIVQAEMLYDPQAPEVGGFKKFVNIPYDPKKLGKQMTLSPIVVKEYSTQRVRPDQVDIIKKLINDSTSDVKLVPNALEHQGINVSKIIQPVLALDPNLVSALSIKGNSKQKTAAKTELTPILDKARQELSDTIANSPNIKGKDVLGNIIEGIVLKLPSGRLVKVTSQDMKKALADKLSQENFGTTDQRTAVVTIGNFVGHKGHEAIINHAFDIGEKTNSPVFAFVGNKQGPDDPIPVGTKIQTLKKLFPTLNIRLLGGSLDKGSDTVIAGQMPKKIEYELIKKDPFYNNIIIVVGRDREAGFKNVAAGMMKRFQDFTPTKHVKVSVDSIDRVGDWSGTKLRNALRDEAADPVNKKGSAKQVWFNDFNPVLGQEYILSLMRIAMENMGIDPNAVDTGNSSAQPPAQPTPQPVQQQPVPQPAAQQPAAPQGLAEQYDRVMAVLIERIIKNELRRP